MTRTTIDMPRLATRTSEPHSEPVFLDRIWDDAVAVLSLTTLIGALVYLVIRM